MVSKVRAQHQFLRSLLSNSQIIHEIQKYEIQIYQLPYCDDDEDDDYKKQTEDLKVKSVFNVMFYICQHES